MTHTCASLRERDGKREIERERERERERQRERKGGQERRGKTQRTHPKMNCGVSYRVNGSSEAFREAKGVLLKEGFLKEKQGCLMLGPLPLCSQAPQKNTERCKQHAEPGKEGGHGITHW